MAKAVTILGMGASAAGDVQAIGEVWSMNDAYQVFTHEGKPAAFSLFFEIHDMLYARNFRSGKCPTDNHFERLNGLGCPVMMRDVVPEIERSIRFPIERVLSAVGTDFLRGTPAFMLAYAIFMGYSHIRVYGIDQMDDGHKYQRESWAHVVGVGIGRGIDFSGVFRFVEQPENDIGLQGWIDQTKTEDK
jgi:hypothetical protein